MSAKHKIALEVAEAEFVRMCEAFRVDYDTAELSEEDLAEWKELRKGIVRDIREGSLIVGAENGKPTYTPPGATKGLTFSSPTGATIISARSKKNEVENTCAAMADMTGVPIGEFGKLDRIDFYACSRLVKLFLADR